MSSTTTVASSNAVSTTGTKPTGKLRYVPSGYTPIPSPHNFHLPAISEFSDVRMVELHDMRPLPTVNTLPLSYPGAAQLSTHGFTAVHHPTSMHFPPYNLSSWKNPQTLSESYIPETEAMVKQITGASTVITEALLLRSALWSEQDALATHAGHGDDPPSAEALQKMKELSDLETGFPQFIGFSPTQGGVSPAPKIHLDYAPNGARLHLRKYHPHLTEAASSIIAAEDSLTSSGKLLKDHYASTSGAPRWALFSIRRPLKTVRRDPLALGDARTFKDSDYVPVNIKSPNLGVPDSTETHEAESYVAHWSQGQKWCWVSEQKPEEVLVIGLFDSARDHKTVAAGGTPHSSVDLDGTDNDTEPRESLELRCLAIWE